MIRSRRRLDEKGSGRLELGAAGCPRDMDGGLLDLIDRNRPRDQQAKHNPNPARHTALAVLPPPHAPWANAEQLGDAVLRDAERAECLARRCRSSVFLVV
jgi:hypothetical protein